MKHKLYKYLQYSWFVFIFFGLPAGLFIQLFYGKEGIFIPIYALFVLIVFLTSFWNVFKKNHQYKLPPQILKMLLSIIVAILGFANIYKFNGIIKPNGQISYAPIDSLYFSIVTWTTLGYGDFQPTIGVRLWAASEALLGTLFLPLFFAALLFAIDPQRKA